MLKLAERGFYYYVYAHRGVKNIYHHHSGTYQMPFLIYLKVFCLLFLVSCFLAISRIYRSWGLAVIAMFLFSLILSYSQYFSSTYRQYSLDTNGHIKYILSIANQGKLPEPFGWQTQQPPLYYAVAACFYKLGSSVGMQDPLYSTRLLSLLLYTGFLILSISTLRYYLSGGYFVLATTIVLFWPDGFTYSGRISNDLGMLFSHSLTLYLTTRWYFNKRPAFLMYALYSALIGITIKGNGIIGLSTMIVITSTAIINKEITCRELLLRRSLFAIGLFCIAINFGRTAYYRWIEGANIKWFINLELSSISNQLVGNSPYNYIYFDIPSFLHKPFFYSVPKGGELFWNAFLKTLLFGEWQWKVGEVAAGIASALLLVIIAYAITYLLLVRTTTQVVPCFPASVMMICMLGALVVARIQVPWSAQCNGRYIFGITVILSLLFAKAIEWHRTQGRILLASIGIGSGIVFAVNSIVMIIYEI